MRARLIALLMSACAGCGLLLDLDSDGASEKRDGGAEADASAMDAAVGDARDGSDAGRPDAARGDSGHALDGRTFDARGWDARPLVDGAADGTVDPERCRSAVAGATELGPSDDMRMGLSTCSGSDLVDFDCLPTTRAEEAYYYVNAMTDVIVTISPDEGPDGFVFSQIDPRDCSLISCGESSSTILMGETAYFVVENRGGGCGIMYTLSTLSLSP